MNINSLGTRNVRTTSGVSAIGSNSKNQFASIVETITEKQENKERNHVSALERNLKGQSLKTEGHPDQLHSKTVEAKQGVETEIPVKGSTKEKLEQIQKLNAETDWSSMSDVEKVKTFEERYYKAFGGQKVFLTAPLYVLHSKQYQEIYDSYSEELDKYFGRDGVSPFSDKRSTSYREAYYGTMNDQEVRAAIREKWEGADSLENKYAILHEYIWAGVDGEGEMWMINQIVREIDRKVESLLGPSMRGTGKSFSDHPRYVEYYMTYAKGVGDGAGFTFNWTQITQFVIDGVERVMQKGGERAMSPEELEELKGWMDDFLADLIEGV